MEKTERAFKGIWIPKEIWLSKKLTMQEKIFLAEIDSLDNEKGCFASNKYFADFFRLSKGRCSQIINKLSEKGFINIKYNRDGEEITERIINVRSKYPKGGYLENDKEYNKDINSIDYNKKEHVGTKYSDARDVFIIDINEIDCNGDFERFALLAWQKIHKVYPDDKTVKRAKLKGWANHVRLMVEQDNRTLKEAWRIFEWANQDGFWQANIRSTGKLREKYDDLKAQKQREINQNPKTKQQNEYERKYREAQDFLDQYYSDAAKQAGA